MTRKRIEATVAAAWVPDDDPDRPWKDAADAAIEWVGNQSALHGGPGQLVTDYKNSCIDEIADFGRRRTWTSVLSRQRGTGPVLCWQPGISCAATAVGLATNFPIVIVERFDVPLQGWAARHQAMNLMTGQLEPPLPLIVEDAVRWLESWSSQGFKSAASKRRACQALDDLDTDALRLVPGAFLAGGGSANNSKALGGLNRWLQQAPR